MIEGRPRRGCRRPLLAVAIMLGVVLATAPAVAQPAGQEPGREVAQKTPQKLIHKTAKATATPTRSLQAVDSWGYQLQNVMPRVFAKDGFDILVIDYSGNGSDEHALSREDLDKLRKRPGRADRYLLAYLSIGEAEEYRYYWQPGWTLQPEVMALPIGLPGAAVPAHGQSLGLPATAAALKRLSPTAPSWLADENPEWRGNYLVRYWDEQWQAIMHGSPTAYLDKILEVGFDGVYLDKIDANDDWQATRPTAERDMVRFVGKLAAYARVRQPDFLIVPQNGEELLEFADYVKDISAIGKEDLLFGGAQRKDGVANPASEIRKSRRHLDKARRAGRPVLVVEYLDRLEVIAAARKRLLGFRYVPLFARRALDLPPQTEPAPRVARP